MDSQTDINRKLDDVLEWANQKLADGQEPPWSWYQFMKLRESIEAIRTGVMVAAISENSPQSVERPASAHPPKACIVPLDTARHHPDVPNSDMRT